MNLNSSNSHFEKSPFNLENREGYQAWRERKLENYPGSLDDLVVEIGDPRQLTESQFRALLDRCRKANMAIYVGTTGQDPDPEIPLTISRRFGVCGLNHNWLADDTGLTSLKVVNDGTRQHYIPYTNRAIKWHTDGYYNTPERQIHSLMLHCVQSAASGGENALMDHEVAYILLRDENPDYIRAFMQPDAMTIPPRMDEKGETARRVETGPVFSITPSGDLHMRYSMRQRNVIWADDPLTGEARACLQQLLESDLPYIHRGRLEPGMGLIGNNVLHDRSAFNDDEVHERHLYRARYFERLAGTGVFD
ncbi:MAG: TauD/TfdA family dioxygenase [Gammaproteobacteria bacterium]|nr:TauD/TfdA family dioxygenase [Gammaproteobacteria bacterium]MCP5406891.1 TauD/TfdA family dioxygenase [Chromatiaceae bacterium]MCP5408468.1 TauD/TfdA family dioxygenase [Chromatiaceae bacterium]MCP5444897.1 TauD/TfdA family dioxygenase [Chromatiaceae bacterium]